MHFMFKYPTDGFMLDVGNVEKLLIRFCTIALLYWKELIQDGSVADQLEMMRFLWKTQSNIL